MAEKINALIMERIFNAPRARVWDAWTQPELFMRWWGPKDYTSPVCKIDLRLGGVMLGCMRGPDGKDIWSTGIYCDIVENERLVITDCFADEKGNVVPASYYGMPGEGWQSEMLVIVELKDFEGKTKMTVSHYGFPDDKVNEMAGAGWNQSFDKLEEIL